MVRNYLLMAFRNFQRQKFFLLLNMLGLGLGLASAILIFLYVSDEVRYDTMHPVYADTYRIGSTWTNKAGESFDNTVAPGAWIRRMKDTRSEVLQATRIDYIGYPTSFHHKATDKIILSEEVKWVEPGFDAIIAFELLKGNREKIFSDYNTIVLSETGARRLFGTADPLGQIITVKHNWATQGREIDVVVTGVYRDYPANSHFKPHYILNVNALRSVVPDFTTYMEGTRFGRGVNLEFFENYVVLKPGADLRPIETMLTEMGTDMAQSDSGLVANGWKIKPLIKKVTDLHFDQKNLWENDNTQGSMEYLFIFSAVALLILFIACINYMNLATARSARRAKEVGLRKSFGSRRSQIAKQFLYESGITTAGSLVMSLIIVVLLLQPFNQLAHKSFTVLSLLDPYVAAIILIISVAMAFLSGSYPAFYLSAFKPVDVLKGQAVKGKGAEMFRKSLVAIQYTVSLVLIISTVIIVRQMQFMQSTKLNQQGSQLLSIRYGGNAPQGKFSAFKNTVLQDKDIQHVTMANHLPRLNYFGWIGARVKFTQLEDKELQWSQLNVDFDFPKTYQLELVAGRDFDPNSIMDSSTLILNEAAVKALNKPVEQVLGATVTDLFENNRTYTVIGVVKDFPFRSMHQEIEPLLLAARSSHRPHRLHQVARGKIPGEDRVHRKNMA
jgi:putative ABC transport system permease protein